MPDPIDKKIVRRGGWKKSTKKYKHALSRHLSRQVKKSSFSLLSFMNAPRFGHPVIGCTAAKFRSFLTLLTDLETTDAGAIVYEMTDYLVLSSSI